MSKTPIVLEKPLYLCVQGSEPIIVGVYDSFGIIVMQKCSIHAVRHPRGSILDEHTELFEIILKQDSFKRRAYVLFDVGDRYELYCQHYLPPQLFSYFKKRLKLFESGEIGYIM